ncbi:UNVERIFIED_CONTAM: hypothetical protein Slati_2660400 [Sesamum latifolium]|uniref:Uncharacterized protein n=1 Tax=Sesamum latifolium TaxID=2727402 RepID=A0AAW2VXY6_9LAMI
MESHAKSISPVEDFDVGLLDPAKVEYCNFYLEGPVEVEIPLNDDFYALFPPLAAETLMEVAHVGSSPEVPTAHAIPINANIILALPTFLEDQGKVVVPDDATKFNVPYDYKTIPAEDLFIPPPAPHEETVEKNIHDLGNLPGIEGVGKDAPPSTD